MRFDFAMDEASTYMCLHSSARSDVSKSTNFANSNDVRCLKGQDTLEALPTTCALKSEGEAGRGKPAACTYISRWRYSGWCSRQLNNQMRENASH